MTEALLTVARLSEMIGVSRQWVYKGVTSGSIPHIRIDDRQIRFRQSEIDAWLKERSK